jgi:hypothetical protein
MLFEGFPGYPHKRPQMHGIHQDSRVHSSMHIRICSTLLA